MYGKLFRSTKQHNRTCKMLSVHESHETKESALSHLQVTETQINLRNRAIPREFSTYTTKTDN